MAMKVRVQSVIKGGRIKVQARNIYSRQKGKRFITKLRKTAYCVIEAQPMLGYSIGDSLKGHIIMGQSDDITRLKVVPGTSRHKAQTRHLFGNAICVIDVPMIVIR